MLETQGTEKTKQYLANLFKAHFTFIYIPTWEEMQTLWGMVKLPLPHLR